MPKANARVRMGFHGEVNPISAKFDFALLIIVFFSIRGLTSNMTAVAMPIAMTIFLTDVLMSNKKNN
jgi:hypothetical protein